MYELTRRFMDDVLRAVPGALPQLDAFLLLELNRLQVEPGTCGGHLKIGAAHGASAVILGHRWRPNEPFVVCDLFGSPADDSLNRQEQADWGYLSLDRQAFEGNFRRFHARLPTIWQQPSTTLRDAGIAPGALRFAHIDGSHLYRVVQADLGFAREAIGEVGVVVFDDVFTGHTRGVGAAVWPTIRQKLRPLIAPTQKLYATWGRDPGFDSSAIREVADAVGAEIYHDDFEVHRVLAVRPPRGGADESRLRRTAREWLPRPLIQQMARLRR